MPSPPVPGIPPCPCSLTNGASAKMPSGKYFPLNPSVIGMKGKERTWLLSVAAPPLLPQRTLLASPNRPPQWPKIPFNHDLASGAGILRAAYPRVRSGRGNPCTSKVPPAGFVGDTSPVGSPPPRFPWRRGRGDPSQRSCPGALPFQRVVSSAASSLGPAGSAFLRVPSFHVGVRPVAHVGR